jgi:hypothetical protein
MVTSPARSRLASFARGVALIMLVGLLGVVFLTYLAANFESGISGRDLAKLATLLSLGGALQAMIFITAKGLDGNSLTQSLGSAISCGFALWLGGAAFYLMLGCRGDFFYGVPAT